MARTAQDVVNEFLRVHPEAGSDRALQYLNEIDEIILQAIPLRRSFVDLALVSGTYEYDLDETILRVWGAQLYTSATEFRKLAGTNIDRLDLDTPNWRGNGAGDVLKWYETASMTSGQIGFTPAPDASTLIVATASNATPIVITTTAAHGLTDGTAVLISGVSGNAPANALSYAKSTGATTFEIYSDAELTSGVAGTGAGTGGMVAATGSPKISLECSQRVAIVLSPDPTPLPTTPEYKPLYRMGMSALFMLDDRVEGGAERMAEFEKMLGAQAQVKMERQAHEHPEITTFKRRQPLPWRRR